MTRQPPVTGSRGVRVEDQLCFVLYSTSRAIMRKYREGLSKLGLTYPQYITMLAVWEEPGRTVKELGRALELDSGTLSPVLKRLDSEGYVERRRSTHDERSVEIFSTERGYELEQQVAPIRHEVEKTTGLTGKEFAELRDTLLSLRDSFLSKP